MEPNENLKCFSVAVLLDQVTGAFRHCFHSENCRASLRGRDFHTPERAREKATSPQDDRGNWKPPRKCRTGIKVTTKSVQRSSAKFIELHHVTTCNRPDPSCQKEANVDSYTVRPGNQTSRMRRGHFSKIGRHRSHGVTSGKSSYHSCNQELAVTSASCCRSWQDI